ncbi:uridylate-specific endoribonuclease B-like [Rhincodon typus]|uniref:uridylate-specific endoribonuclease B-like n=1 Tax=Rhincodon typus TaxID=259920 RepID=UPI00202E49DC|nr:uridylate-specific endoribonuclease B-like [Rhincodon typus]
MAFTACTTTNMPGSRRKKMNFPLLVFSAPSLVYGTPYNLYSAPCVVYSAPNPVYSAPNPVYSAPNPVYSVPCIVYSASSLVQDFAAPFRMENNTELSDIAQILWDNDVNRLQPGIDYKINLQAAEQALTNTDIPDGAGLPLFLFVNEDVFKRKTFSAFISLLDNYEADTREPEVIIPEEEVEIRSFLDAVMETPVLQIAHRYLIKKRTVKVNKEEFKQQLYDIWFCLYARKGSSLPDSSGFEHVFVSETRGGRTVIGFHNWIQFYLQEKLGHVVYKGYTVKNNRLKLDENKHLITLHFSWKKGVKMRGSCFMAVSPEFEFALYIIIFLSSSSQPHKLRFSQYEVEIVCHRNKYKNTETIYPILLQYLPEAS